MGFPDENDVLSRLAPNLDGFTPEEARRIFMTVSCSDSDQITKVKGAGETRDDDGRRVQMMHNGLLVEEGGYFGGWMSEIIRTLRGHHEPQEELVFDRIIKRLQMDDTSPVMIELGSFWTYYGLWFCRALRSSCVLALEPDPAYLEVGRRNAELNGLSDQVTFFHAAIGSVPGQKLEFHAESDGREYEVEQHDLASLMRAAKLERADLVLADVQGAESVLLSRAQGDFGTGRVRFLIVSTHHHSISGDPLTHQRALALLIDTGAHVISEHSVNESFSGDGLIAVSFDDRDRDFVVPVSHARSKESLFGEMEVDLAASEAKRLDAERIRTDLTSERDAVQAELIQIGSERDCLRAQLDAISGTKMWRWSRRPRQAYQRVRRG